MAMMRILAGALLFLHGSVHLLGAIVYWKVAEIEDLPYPTTFLDGRAEATDTAIAVLGGIWLLAAVGFALGGVALASGLEWWKIATASAAIVSIGVAVPGLPDAAIGLAVSVVVLVAMALYEVVVAPRLHDAPILH
jgi:hypothetical protein